MLVTLRISRPLFAAVVEHSGTRLNLLCTVGLLLTLLVLVPFGHASPGDPPWITGIYDGADLDESIEAVTSMIGIVEGLPAGACNPLAFIARVVPPSDAPFPQAVTPSTFSVRAPPAV
jgi:hypothetical protein